MTCSLPDQPLSSDDFPTFSFWLFHNPINLIGVITTLAFIIFYGVAWSRSWVYSIFLRVHSWFPLLYILVFLHSLNQLMAYPVFWPLVSGSVILLALDRMWTGLVTKQKITVVQAEILPNKVIKLTMEKVSKRIYMRTMQ